MYESDHVSCDFIYWMNYICRKIPSDPKNFSEGKKLHMSIPGPRDC